MNFRFRIPDWILLLAFCGFFFFWRLASFGLIGADEPRYAQVAREMLAAHDWVTPTLGGLPWLEKPPLYYWQAMLAYRVFGVTDWAARLPSVLDATFLVFATYFFLRRLRRGVERDGALMLVSCAGIVGFARAASTDMPLAATLSAALLCWYGWFESKERKFLTWGYVFLALGTLAKGPVAPFLAIAIIGFFAAIRRSWSVLTESISLHGISAFCVVAFPWYLLVQLRNPQFARIFLLEHNLGRFGTNMFHHPEPFWYYLPVTLLGWLPWVVFVIAAIVWAARAFKTHDADPLDLFLFIWIAVVVIFFSISRSKLPGYVLPALPAGAILIANHLAKNRFRRIHWTIAAIHGLVIAALMFATLVSASVLQQHAVWNSSLTIPAIAAILAGSFFAAALMRNGYAGLHLAGLAPAIVALALAIRFDSNILNARFSARSVSDSLQALSTGKLPVAVVLVPRELEFGLQFYRNQAIPRYELRQAPKGEHLVVSRQGFAKAFAKDVPGRRIVYLGSFPQQNVEFFYVSQ